MDDKRMECILRSLFAELSDQEAWSLTRELSRQLEGKPLFQVLYDYLPDADHRDAAEKITAAVDDMYQGLEQRDTWEALAFAAARYILNQEERENPYDLGLSAVDLVEGRRLLDAMKNASLTRSEKASTFIAYYSVFLRKGSLMEIETLKEAAQKLLNIN